MLKVSIINYGVGNLRNVKRGLKKAGGSVKITNMSKEFVKSSIDKYS